MRYFLLAALLLLTSPAVAQTCVPIDVTVAYWQSHPVVVDVYVATPAEAKIAVGIVNAMPPESEDEYANVILATLNDDSGAILVGNENLICAVLPMPAATWRIFVRSVRGQGV